MLGQRAADRPPTAYSALTPRVRPSPLLGHRPLPPPVVSEVFGVPAIRAPTPRRPPYVSHAGLPADRRPHALFRSLVSR
jgi:hypothetical protein